MIQDARTADTKTRVTPWTADEMEYLAAHYATDGPREIAGRLGRGFGAVQERAKALGLYRPTPHKPPHAWGPADLAALRRLYPTRGAYLTAKLMGRDDRNVRRKAEALGLTCTRDVIRQQNIDRWEAQQAAEAAAILDPEPTAAKPGTLAKIAVMAERAAAGRWLFHDDDAPTAIDDPDERAPADAAAVDAAWDLDAV